VATLVDRATRYAMVVALPDGRKADAVARALIEQMGRLPVHLRRSLTRDRGLEMAQHAAITAALSMPVFFCDPHHPWQPWQRGTNENTNRLLRQYLPKNADLGRFSQDHLNSVAPNSITAPGGCSAGSPRPKRSVGSRRRRCLRLRSRSDSGLRSWPHDRRRASAAGRRPRPRWCANQVPEHIRSEIRVECDVAARHLTICECRPPWREDVGPDWTRFPIARLHYTSTTGLWTLYWRDQNLKYHRYQALDPSPRIQDLLDYLDSRADPSFLG